MIVVFFCFGAVGLHEFSGIETVSAAVVWMGVKDVVGQKQGESGDRRPSRNSTGE